MHITVKRMKHLIKAFSITLALLTAFSACLACADVPENKTSLYVITMFGGTDEHAPVYNAINAEFSAASGVEITDNSAKANPVWRESVKTAFLTEVFTPHVLFFFNGKSADSIREHLVPLDEIIAYDADYGKDIRVAVDDDACLPVKGFSEGIIYNTDYFAEADFADYQTMKSKIISFNTEENKGKVSAGYDIPHYWLNHLLAQELGAEEFNALDGSKAFFEADEGRKERWLDALTSAVTELMEMGVCTSHERSESNETKLFFEQQQRGLLLDGSWAAGNIGAAQEKFKVAGFPQKDAQSEEFVLSGFTSGWYITRKAWNDESVRRSAVDFVKAHTSAAAVERYCLEAGGIPATLRDIAQASDAVNMFKALINERVNVTPIDDRLGSAANVLYDKSTGLPGILTNDNLKTRKALKESLEMLLNSVINELT